MVVIWCEMNEKRESHVMLGFKAWVQREMVVLLRKFDNSWGGSYIIRKLVSLVGAMSSWRASS